MTPLEQAAKAAYEAMIRSFCREDGWERPEDHRWENQSEQCHQDWMAAVTAAVAEEREACAKAAEDFDPSGHMYERSDRLEQPTWDIAAEAIAAAIRARDVEPPRS